MSVKSKNITKYLYMLLNYSFVHDVHYHTDHVYICARSDEHIDFHAKNIAESNNLTKYMSNKRHKI
jgi:hypothetical protein